jgi:hypothetical protein
MDEKKTMPLWKLKAKIAFEEAKAKAAQTAKAGVNWVACNKELTLGLAAGALGIAKAVSKATAGRREDKIHDCRHWDPRAGDYVWSRRKLTRREKREFDERYTNGESKFHILDDMGLLK